MGSLDIIRDSYYRAEDRYYQFLDWLDTKVPIYWLIEPIDKIVPSFALFLLLLILFILWLLFFVFSLSLFTPKTTLTFSVTDPGGVPLNGIIIGVEYDETFQNLQTGGSGQTKELKVNQGTFLTYTVAKDGYLPDRISDTFELTQSEQFVTILLTPEPQFKEVSFSVLDSKGQLVTKLVRLDFACSNSGIETPESMDVISGTGKVAVPLDCGGLKVTASALGFVGVFNRPLSDNGSIFLQEEEILEPEIKNGIVRVNLYFNDNRVEGDSISVQLYKSFGTGQGSFVEESDTITGQVQFEAEAGNYFVKVVSTRRFAATQSPEFTVRSNEEKNLTLSLEEQIIGHIKLRVRDNSNVVISNARVSLISGLKEVEFRITNSDDAIIEFNIKEDKLYQIVVDHEDYCIEKLHDVRINPDVITLNLVRDTGQCGTTLSVIVLDNDTSAIRNATVSLFGGEGQSLGISERKTDLNGVAKFTGIEAGNYKAFAYKGFTSGWSDTKQFIRREREPDPYIITLDIPDATAKINVVDREGEPVLFSNVSLFDADTRDLIAGPKPTENQNGEITFTVKAARPIYATVTKTGMTDFVSRTVLLIPGEINEIEARLEPEILRDEVKTELLGLYRDERLATVLSPGKTYTALFNIKLPKNNDFEKILFHVRTGDDNHIIEQDNLYIKEVRASGAERKIAGSSFFPEDGLTKDTKYLSSNGAKWVNSMWEKFSNGILTVEADITIRQTARPGEKLELHWRMAGEEDSFQIDRDPKDERATESLNIDELYSATKTQILEIGQETLCDQTWCFTASILDVDEDLTETVFETYDASVGANYLLSFQLVNAGLLVGDIFPDSQIKISNPEETTSFGEYVISGADNRKVEGAAQEFETNWIDSQTLTRNKTITGQIYFSPKKPITSTILIQLKSGQSIVLEKEIVIEANAIKQMFAEFEQDNRFVIDPPVLPSGLEQTVRVKVKDSQTNIELEDVRIKARDKSGTILTTALTSSLGTADVKIPALLPGETLTMQFEKAEYEVFEAIIRVDSGVLEFKPGSLGFALNPKTITDDTKTVTAINKTDLEMEIEHIELMGDFQGKINTQASEDWFTSQYKGKKILERESMNIQVKVSLSPAGLLVIRPESFNAKLKITTKSGSQKWINELPVNISIGISGQVDDPSCLFVSLREWKTLTQGQPVSKDFTIRNNCTVNGNPIELKNLKSKTEFLSNPIGDFFIELQGKQVASGEEFEQLILGRIGKGETMSGTFTFTPDGGVIGSQKALITITAENPQESEKEILRHEVDAEISVINLSDCISFNKDLVILKENSSDTVEITTTNCKGPVNLEFVSELELNKKSTTILETGTFILEIFAGNEIPGQYPVTVNAKGGADTQLAFKKLIRARIETDGCLTMDSYEFNILDVAGDPFDGYDVGELINRCHKKTVSFNAHVNEKDLYEAMKTGGTWAVVGAVYGGLGMLFGGGGTAGEAVLEAPFDTHDIITPTTPTGLQLLGGLEGTLGIASTVLGINNPIQGALIGFIGGTAFAYTQQKEFDFPFETNLDDMVVDEIKLLLMNLREDVISTDITMETGEEKILTTPENELGFRTVELFFENTAGITNPDPETPFYRILKAQGRNLTYVEEFDTKKQIEVDLFEPQLKEQDPFTRKFRLQFNATKDVDPVSRPVKPVSCSLGGKTGTTGDNAVPDVFFDWDWSSIDSDTCDELGDSMYCDATQFTISLLERLNEIDTLLSGQSLTCPVIENLLAEETNELSELDKDYAVTKVQVDDEFGEAKVSAVIESSNNKTTQGRVKITLEGLTNGQTITCSTHPNGEDIEILSRSEVDCTFSSIPQGKYIAKAELTLDIASCGIECKNSKTDNDTLTAEFETNQQSNFVKCQPYSTARLDEYIESNPANQNLITAKELANFKAFLIKDGYTQDFIDDFHEFSTTKTFFQTPTFYTNSDGLGEIFSHPDYFEFKAAPLSSGFGVLPAGKYQVDINITYENENWLLFENGNPKAKIIVSLERLQAPIPDSPFYHLPFDGLVGVDSGNGRQGYGVNFRQTSADSVNINSSTTQPVKTSTIASSVPVNDGWLNAGLIDEFSILNNENRGVVLEVEKDSTSGGYNLNLSPSNATPIILKVDGGNSSNAYTFYSLTVDGEPQQPGSNLTLWSGLGLRCKDFSDRETLEAFSSTPDIRGAVGKTQCSTSFLPTQYGIEWCELKRSGSVFLSTIFFTPQQASSFLDEIDSKDASIFIAPNEAGNKIELTGIQGGTINSVADAIQLVRDEMLCVSESDDSVTEFFWNPAKVFEPLDTDIDNVSNLCIAPFSEP